MKLLFLEDMTLSILKGDLFHQSLNNNQVEIDLEPSFFEKTELFTGWWEDTHPPVNFAYIDWWALKLIVFPIQKPYGAFAWPQCYIGSEFTWVLFSRLCNNVNKSSRCIKVTAAFFSAHRPIPWRKQKHGSYLNSGCQALPSSCRQSHLAATCRACRLTG
jgi:hypothetical protein